jgi:hypothetical protein
LAWETICITLVSMEGDFEDICPDDYGRRKNLAGILIPHSLGWLSTFRARFVPRFRGCDVEFRELQVYRNLTSCDCSMLKRKHLSEMDSDIDETVRSRATKDIVENNSSITSITNSG